MKRTAALVLALLVGLLPSVFAQVSTGNVYGKVNDESGAALPGATVKLVSAAYGTRETTAGAEGDFRFLNVERGTYRLEVGLAGFGTVSRDVLVTVGNNVTVSFGLKIATVAETVTVTAETPTVDTKRVGTSTTITKEELTSIPSARDPWAMLRTVPGIIMDRVNIGGNENGQQANFTGKGDNGNNVMWNLDGVVVTDTGSLSSPSYYDFDAFEEVAVSTGGNDVRAQTGGVGINLTTRRGTNAFHGSVHEFFTDHKFESKNLPSNILGDPRLRNPGGCGISIACNGTFRDEGDHIDRIQDYGGELGGPIMKDKLWFYGSWGKQDIKIQRINGTFDNTQLTSYNAKVNWQATQSDMVSAFVFNGAKDKQGRSTGLPNVDEAPETLWNQGNSYAGSPHGFVKLQADHTFGPSLFASVKLSNYETGFFLHPAGGDMNGTYDLAAGVTRGAYLRLDNTRPAKTANVDANYFKSGQGGNHEFKFGFGYRRFNVTTTTHWGGDGLFAYNLPGSAYVHVARDARNATQADYWSAYAGDTFTKDRLTLNVGARWDRQRSKNLASSVPASKTLPSVLGAIDFDGSSTNGRTDHLAPQITWNDVSPRVGLTVALDKQQKTVARASYAYYASQLPSGQAAFFSPFQSPGAYFAYNWDDRNGDGLPQPNEVRTDLGLAYSNYVDATDPNGPGKNELDPNFHAQHDHEAVLGLDRELATNLSFGVAYTWRRNSGQIWTPRVGMTTADYRCTVATNNGVATTGCTPSAAKVAEFHNARLLTNRPDYHRGFTGFEATLAKRLSNRWSARAAFTWNDSKEYIDGPGAIQNPTRTDASGALVSGPQVNGGLYSPRSSGSGKGDTIIGAKWQVAANALVQLPWSFELAGAYFMRQGHPFAVETTRRLGDDGLVRVLADNTKIDSQRYPTVKNLDLRLAKTVKFGKAGLVMGLDVFNVFNSNTILGLSRNAGGRGIYNYDTHAGAFMRPSEILNPRVARLSARFQF
jgi:hypothetical protein